MKTDSGQKFQECLVKNKPTLKEKIEANLLNLFRIDKPWIKVYRFSFFYK